MEAKNPQKNQTPDQDLLPETQITHQFFQYLNINENQELDENEDQEEEFSFMSGEPDTSPISAEEAFLDGKIKPVFPLFNSESMFPSVKDLPINKPNVDKVFVEMPERRNDNHITSFATKNDVIAGPSRDWLNREAVEVLPEKCKKSNSTGFSKIWRFKEFIGRSNSGGRDAFVFLNNSHAPPDAPVKLPAPAVKESKRKAERKGKKATVSAHETYLKSKSKAEEGRRSSSSSYLPYRPALMGFFTNVNGGLTRNVHPY